MHIDGKYPETGGICGIHTSACEVPEVQAREAEHGCGQAEEADTVVALEAVEVLEPQVIDGEGGERARR